MERNNWPISNKTRNFGEIHFEQKYRRAKICRPIHPGHEGCHAKKGPGRTFLGRHGAREINAGLIVGFEPD